MQMFSSNLEFLPVAIVLFSALLSLLLPQKCAKILLILSIFIAIFFCGLLVEKLQLHDFLIYNFGNWQAPYGIVYRLDRVNVMLAIMLLLVAFAVIIASREITQLVASIFGLYLSALIGMAFSHDIFNIYVFMEIASIAAYVLVLNDSNKKSNMAAFNYLVAGSVATGLILLAIGLLYLETGSLSLTDIDNILEGKKHTIGFIVAYLLLIIGLLIKIGFLGSWLLDVYKNSSTAIVAFFAGAANKIYLYLLIKLVFFLSLDDSFLRYLTYFSWLSLIAASFMAFKSRSSLKILTYASIVQLSYVVLLIPLSLKNDKAFDGMLLLILNHAFTAPVLFLLQGKKRSGNIGKTLFFYQIASSIGLPLTLGFVGKWYLLLSLMQAQDTISMLLVIISSGASLFYYLRLWFVENDANASALTKRDIFASLVLTLLSLLLCVFSNKLIHWIGT
jgi:multicomponent Na+:H+ antiporter subunit D